MNNNVMPMCNHAVQFLSRGDLAVAMLDLWCSYSIACDRLKKQGRSRKSFCRTMCIRKWPHSTQYKEYLEKYELQYRGLICGFFKIAFCRTLSSDKYLYLACTTHPYMLLFSGDSGVNSLPLYTRRGHSHLGFRGCTMDFT